MTRPFAITFPGQGSQSVGMLAELAGVFPIVRHTFDEGSDALDLDLWSLVQQGPAARLDETQNTQPALLCAGLAVQRVLEQQLSDPPLVMAGHSLGEYTALTAAGVFALSDAVRLVADRGRYMQEAVPVGTGAMAAILGLDDDAVRAACEQGAQGEVVAPVNFNSPGQVVIAGTADAVGRAIEFAKAAGAKRALALDVSVPSHCDLMLPAAERLRDAMASMDLGAPSVPVLHNVDVQTAADSQEMRERLVQQLHSPVRWVETVKAMTALGADVLIEAGPGKVLTGLVKRIDKTVTAVAVFDPASLDNAMETLNA